MIKGSHQTREAIEKMREARRKQISPMLGRHHTKETKEKMRLAHLDKPTWNKGLTIEQDNRIGKPWLGKKRSQKTKEKISKAKKGENHHFYGKHFSKEHKRKLSEAHSHYTKEQIRKMMQSQRPTSLEKKFLEIIKKHNLPYKYVGDNSFKIDKYNPDFINVNSEKIAIEVYTRYFKERGFRNIEKWKEKRSKTFAKYGWSMFFFDETQINEDYVLEKLKERR